MTTPPVPKSILQVNNWVFYVNPKCGIRTINILCKKLNKLPKEIFKEKKNIFVYRNPYNRLLSGYLNKYIQHEKYFIPLQKFKIDKNDINTFHKFLKIINKRGINVLDHCHFSQQICILPKNIKINKMFETEKINDLIDYINIFIEKYDKSLKLEYKTFNFTEVSKHDMKAEYNLMKKPYDLNRKELLKLIKDKQIPEYEMFYTDKLKEVVKKCYYRDFKYLKKNLIN